MTEYDDRQIGDALKRSFPPVHTELERDLWPQVLRKLDDRPVRVSFRVPWYDWALVALSTAMFLAFPRLILVFVYHL